MAVHIDDTEDKIAKLADKIIKLRIFEDAAGKMNLALGDVGGAVLVVSQFTLYGDVSDGNRPSFIASAKPGKALPFYEKFVKYLSDKGIYNESIGSFEFGVYLQELEEKNTEIKRGDFVKYFDGEKERFFEVSKSTNIKSNNSILGYKPIYTLVSAVYVKENVIMEN